MAASVCVKTVLSKLLRLLFEDNINITDNNIKTKHSSLFIAQLFRGTGYSFKISKTTVYICSFKTNDVKMKTIFSLKVTIKVILPWKQSIILWWLFWPELCPLYHYHLHMDLPSHPPTWWKKTLPQLFELSKLKSPHLLGGGRKPCALSSKNSILCIYLFLYCRFSNWLVLALR